MSSIPKWGRVLLPLAAIVTVGVLFVGVFWYQISARVELRRIASKSPVLYKTPLPLSDNTVSRATGATLSYFGYEFESPWTVDKARGKTLDNRAVIAFDSGNAMTFASLPKDDFVNGIASTLNVAPTDVRRIFGSQAGSDYAFKSLILNTTPSRITLRTPWRQCNSTMMLLMFKGVMLPSPDIDLFTLQTKGFRGFQYGDPKRQPIEIGVELYSNDGAVEFYFRQKTKGAGTAITQADINRVITTVHREATPSLSASQ